MAIRGLARLVQQSESWRQLVDALATTRGNLLLSGLNGASKSLLTASLFQELAHPFVYITATAAQAEQLQRDLQSWLPGCPIYGFPARENPLFGIAALSPELTGERLRALRALSSGERAIVVMPWEALIYRLPGPAVFSRHSLTLRYGQQLDPEQIIASLVQAGYERVDMVERPGEFSRRGGILDIYSLDAEWPSRIEFFGDEIDLIRSFDLTTQRSIENLEEVTILPAQEAIWPQEAHAAGVKRLEKAFEHSLKSHPYPERLREHLAQDIERLREGQPFARRECYAPFFLDEMSSLFDYLPTNARVLIDEPSRLLEQAEADYEHYAEGVSSLLENGRLLKQQAEIALSPSEVLARLPEGTLFLSLFPRRPAAWRIGEHVAYLARQVPAFHGQLGYLRQELRRLLQNDYRVVIAVASEERSRNISQSLEEDGFVITRMQNGEMLPPEGRVSLMQADLETGFELPESKLFLLTEGDMLHRTRARPRARTSKAEGARLANYRDLAVGDYVVHVQHGIGRYLGIKTLEIDGLSRDYLHVEYAGEDKLYVPTDQVHLLQKYVGAEGKKPKVYSLGGGDWQKVKSRVKASVQEMAKELLVLYAARQSRVGDALPPDNEWQKQMEEHFPYQETEDQLSAITAIKADMEHRTIMDRLLCGDVGYGKTEVAVRAAFKAAINGYQVAVLVPTTILAQQHYNTFRERFAGFPLQVSLMSRFRSSTENSETAKRLSQGVVDVVVGTHRLLQKDVKFKSLGLLIVDEEQRFGVGHKEKLKLLKENVDTLTLTATPIPRTLHMALVGIRDISVIETPPEDRFPVQTYVVEYNDELVKRAIRRELERGGQVYYVHNRVRSIRHVADKVRALVPEARVAIGHGQLGEEKLEQLMLDFLEGEYDVLVSTTIIETGLDISNVNTIIIEDADRFGLAQLYQLRGRVGRTNRVAYAYLTYRQGKSLTEIADKRLQAIKEFTELGSGFKIAMRDLEIRGAGNLLGPEQHGFMVSVGFDLYCQLLEEAVRELQGKPQAKPIETEVQVPFDAYIPGHYLRDSKQKIEMYKKIRAAESEADLMEIEDEFIDRYGPLPEAVSNLMLAARLRVAASKLGLVSLAINDLELTMRFAEGTFLSAENIEYLYKETGGKLKLHPGKPGLLRWPRAEASPISLARAWLQVVSRLVEEEQKEEESIAQNSAKSH